MQNARRLCIAVAIAAVVTCMNAPAQDKAAYQRRSAARHVELFTWLDRDRDDAVSRIEAEGDLNFTPIFDDVDINRDGVATKPELDRYVELLYGSRPDAVGTTR